jgi:hypothetical protein
MLGGNDHFFEEANKEIGEDEARYPLQENDYLASWVETQPGAP